MAFLTLFLRFLVQCAKDGQKKVSFMEVFIVLSSKQLSNVNPYRSLVQSYQGYFLCVRLSVEASGVT